ncbi:hypothetical protein K457DRAFT_25763 [Linnemannia elongata AG-77]|uniref:Uncharacterized protein n=1 Tax=Linnemannia elongata AG-77 TaxID=1314771 RepID=A0A197JE04_9FUNG|nr:hypothetical protein K457DRAFT_25763 [Linnemannia elongata AG-77]
MSHHPELFSGISRPVIDNVPLFLPVTVIPYGDGEQPFVHFHHNVTNIQVQMVVVTHVEPIVVPHRLHTTRPLSPSSFLSKVNCTAQVQLETLVINPTQEQVAEGDHAVDNDVEHDNAVEGQDMQVDHVDGDYVFEVEET